MLLIWFHLLIYSHNYAVYEPKDSYYAHLILVKILLIICNCGFISGIKMICECAMETQNAVFTLK